MSQPVYHRAMKTKDPVTHCILTKAMHVYNNYASYFQMVKVSFDLQLTRRKKPSLAEATSSYTFTEKHHYFNLSNKKHHRHLQKTKHTHDRTQTNKQTNFPPPLTLNPVVNTVHGIMYHLSHFVNSSLPPYDCFVLPPSTLHPHAFLKYLCQFLSGFSVP